MDQHGMALQHFTRDVTEAFNEADTVLSYPVVGGKEIPFAWPYDLVFKKNNRGKWVIAIFISPESNEHQEMYFFDTEAQNV